MSKRSRTAAIRAVAALRAAVAAAASGDTIDFSALACSTITLTSGAIAIPQASLTLQGPGADALVIDGDFNDRVFRHTGTGTLSLADVAISDGKYVSATTPTGGCIESQGQRRAHDIGGVRMHSRRPARCEREWRCVVRRGQSRRPFERIERKYRERQRSRDQQLARWRSGRPRLAHGEVFDRDRQPRDHDRGSQQFGGCISGVWIGLHPRLDDLEQLRARRRCAAVRNRLVLDARDQEQHDLGESCGLVFGDLYAVPHADRKQHDRVQRGDLRARSVVFAGRSRSSSKARSSRATSAATASATISTAPMQPS